MEEAVWASTAGQRSAGGRGRGACRHHWVVQDRGFWDGSHEGRRGARERRLLGGRGSPRPLVAKGGGGHGSVPEGWTDELTEFTGQ